MFVAQDLAYRLNDMVLIYNEAPGKVKLNPLQKNTFFLN